MRARPLLALMLPLMLLSGCLGPPSLRPLQGRDRPSSRELKLLLGGERFTQREQAFQDYWALVSQVAAEQGLRVQKSYGGFREKRRTVIFWDTADFALRKRGYVLRERIRYRKGARGSRTELTLKYRSSTLAEASHALLSSPGRRVDLELEEDVALAPGTALGRRSVYASRNKVKLSERPETTLAAFGETFPGLLQLGLPPDVALQPVNGRKIDEWRISPGKLRVPGGPQMKADLTVWLDEDGRPLIAEFSFDHSLRRSSPETDRGLYAFYAALAERSAEWLAPEGSTKTAFTYGRKRARDSTAP